MKTRLFVVALAFLLAACGGGNASNPAPVQEVNSVNQNTAPTSPPPIPFTGDACEYAKREFINAYREYQKHLGDALLHERQQQARLAVEAVCAADKDDEPKTWACAEGHSCR